MNNYEERIAKLEAAIRSCIREMECSFYDPKYVLQTLRKALK